MKILSKRLISRFNYLNCIVFFIIVFFCIVFSFLWNISLETQWKVPYRKIFYPLKSFQFIWMSWNCVRVHGPATFFERIVMSLMKWWSTSVLLPVIPQGNNTLSHGRFSEYMEAKSNLESTLTPRRQAMKEEVLVSRNSQRTPPHPCHCRIRAFLVSRDNLPSIIAIFCISSLFVRHHPWLWRYFLLHIYTRNDRRKLCPVSDTLFKLLKLWWICFPNTNLWRYMTTITDVFFFLCVYYVSVLINGTPY